MNNASVRLAQQYTKHVLAYLICLETKKKTRYMFRKQGSCPSYYSKSVSLTPEYVLYYNTNFQISDLRQFGSVERRKRGVKIPEQ